ncbi:asparaginase [Fodinisporobacter ferrooxydans]|uniref:asparaginase n=1 Tax=Fodinisporobacter ferrooxydans TaxID=2901836 RepID=A0ABY4CKH9_9BACL|nr:asparaginase [Alicyclobacillaceae bacterium MYW30-H2]
MKHVLILTTGGTIAMVESKEKGILPKADASTLIQSIPQISEYANISTIEFTNLPSPHITPKHMLELSQKIRQYIDSGSYHGIVVTHGTDTLEETAYFLDLTIASDLPIVVTGAMRSSNELGADGPINVVNAVRVAAHPKAKGFGTLVVFNDEIHAARDVTKTHTSNVSTFQSPGIGPVGAIDKKHVHMIHGILDRKTVPVETIREHVGLVKFAAGIGGELIDCLREKKVSGIVIEALGQGNVPPQSVPAIKRCIEEHIPIVMVSRCYNGVVSDFYAYEGAGRQLKEMGVIFSNGLNGQKARIKLMIGLEICQSEQELRAFFEDESDIGDQG